MAFWVPFFAGVAATAVAGNQKVRERCKSVALRAVGGLNEAAHAVADAVDDLEKRLVKRDDKGKK